MKRVQQFQTSALSFPAHRVSFSDATLVLLVLFLQFFAFGMNANTAENFTTNDSFDEANLAEGNYTASEDDGCNTIGFSSYEQHDPACGANNGSIKVKVTNPNNYCLVYRLYNYTNSSWQTDYQTSRTFKNLPAGKYRVKMFVNLSCDINDLVTTCYTPSSYLNLNCENLNATNLTINNNGDCAARIYWWVNTGDQYQTTIEAGDSWTTSTYSTYMWRAINENPNWNNLSYDEHYTVTSANHQDWDIEPDYCDNPCSAKFEHVDGINESACDANDGKIITDPHINSGTVLPYTVKYTFENQVFTAGPYQQNKDNYITDLAPGVYSNITLIDANGCEDILGNNITIAEYTDGCSGPDCTPVTLVNYDMDACVSYGHNGTNFDYSEFDAAYPEDGNFTSTIATNVFRKEGAHSCIAGQGGSGRAACFGVNGLNSFTSNSDLAIRFEVTVNPSNVGKLTGLKFQEMAPDYFSHISGNTGTNNYPRKYGVRVTKNGNEIFKQIDIATTQEWSLESFDFSNDTDFIVTEETTFKFELLAYDAVSLNGATLSAWDLDDISIEGVDCAGTASIGDFVFNDANGNGIKEANEFGLPDVVVMLLNANGNMVDNTTTNQDGVYTFNNVAAGDYKVKFPATGSANSLDYVLTIPNAGNADNDSDAVLMPGTSNAMTQIFTVNEGDQIDSIDAGYYIASALSGTTFNDANGNGLQDLNEPRVSGVLVMLLDENGNMVDQTNTNNDGVYMFTGLAPGSYKTKFPTTATLNNVDLILTGANQGTNDAIDSDAVTMTNDPANAMTQIVTVQNGQTVDNLDAGYVAPARLGDFVFNDKNANGVFDGVDTPLRDTEVNLTGTDVFGNTITQMTFSNDQGFYDFNNLFPGTYVLEFISPQGDLIPTEQDANGNASDNIDSDIDAARGKTNDITLVAGEYNKTIDAGFTFNSSLPVELTSFEAQLKNDNQVLLKWATASELNNRFFIVERSTDGNDYASIGVVDGKGTTTSANTYSLTDTDPFYGANYYRLKQVDFDGKYEYSEIETVIISGNEIPDLIVYPNPVVNTTTLRVVTPFEKDTQIDIVDQTGKTLQTILMVQGANSKQIDLSGYTEGLYFAYINYNGHRTLIYSLVKVEE